MPYYSIGFIGDSTVSTASNTLVDEMRVLTVGNDFYVVRVDLVGKGAAQASITGIEIDLIRYTTPSTGGTTIAIQPRNPRSPAAVTTAFSPTVTPGTTLKYQWAGGMMSSGQGGFQAVDPLLQDAIYLVNGGGANGNLDLEDQTEGTASPGLKYRYTMLGNEV